MSTLLLFLFCLIQLDTLSVELINANYGVPSALLINFLGSRRLKWQKDAIDSGCLLPLQQPYKKLFLSWILSMQEEVVELHGAHSWVLHLVLYVSLNLLSLWYYHEWLVDHSILTRRQRVKPVLIMCWLLTSRPVLAPLPTHTEATGEMVSVFFVKRESLLEVFCRCKSNA